MRRAQSKPDILDRAVRGGVRTPIVESSCLRGSDDDDDDVQTSEPRLLRVAFLRSVRGMNDSKKSKWSHKERSTVIVRLGSVNYCSS